MLNPPVDTYCKACGYCLYGLREPICPECGGRFDPDDQATFSRSNQSVGGMQLLIEIVAACVVFISPFFSRINYQPPQWTAGMIIYITLLCAGYLTELGVASACVGDLVRVRGKNCHKCKLIAALVISLLIVIGCPGSSLLMMPFVL